MLKRLVCLVAKLAFVIFQRAEINRVLEGTGLHVFLRVPGRVVDHRVADVAVVGDDLAGIAYVITIVTTEAA